MPLIKCKECGNEISDQALTCPHCGVHTEWEKERQNKKLRTRKMRVNIISAILIVTFVGIGCCSLHPIGVFLRHLEYSDEFNLGSIFEILGCILSFGLGCLIFAYKRSRVCKVISVSLFCLYVIATLLYIAIGFVNEVCPTQQFVRAYCNENALNALKDAKLAWGKEVEISFHDDMVVFAGGIFKTELHIDSVTNDGEIYVNCTVTDLQKMFEDRLENYFESSKVTSRDYLENKDKHYLSIYPNCYDSDFIIRYRGYFANYPQTSYRPTNSYHGSYGEIADGIRISSVNYDDAGWFCLEVKLNRNRASIITSEY